MSLIAVTDVAVAAIISGASAIFGGLATAYATRSLEKMRLRAELEERDEKRKVNAAEAFSTQAFAWFEWVTSIGRWGAEAREDEKIIEESNRRSGERQVALRNLLLFSSDRLYTWLTEVYRPVEYEFNQLFTQAIDRGEPLSDEAHEARRRLGKLLREDLLVQLRAETPRLAGSRK